jgi:hypothetical protein
MKPPVAEKQVSTGAMPTLAVGMMGRHCRAFMLAVSLRSLSKHGTHKSPPD